jgi:glycosyl transferase family 2
MKLVMTLLIRDEEDILEQNLRYHFARGIDFVIALDNGSVDGTSDILLRYEEAGLLHMVEEPPADEWFPRHQGRWVTRMARLAATEFDADWVINNDADEFWWPVSGSLRDVFAEVPERFGALIAPRSEFVARPDGPGSAVERLLVREKLSRTSAKVAHRGVSDVNVRSGCHVVETEASARHLHRPRKLMRPLVADDGGDPDYRLVPVPRWPVRILHLPIRSYEQYERLARNATQGATGGRRRELARADEDGRLPELYERLLLDDEAVEEGIRAGRFVADHRLRDFLARCPDPVTEGPTVVSSEAVTPRVGPADVQAELAEIEFEVAVATAQTERSQSERIDRLTKRVDRLAARLREAIQRPVWAEQRRPRRRLWRRAR